jgi:ankyrin repeat protein
LLYTVHDVLSDTDPPTVQLFKVCKLSNSGALSFFSQVKCSRLEAVSYILNKFSKSGLDVNQQDGRGFTPLMYSCIYSANNEQLVNLLLRNRADPNIFNKQGYSPLFYAALQTSGFASSRLLLSSGANINRADHKGMSPLHHAVRLGKTKSVNFLLMYNARVNTQDEQGDTPLMKACRLSDSFKTVKLLLRRYADVNIKNCDGWTALFFASAAGNAALVSLLLQNNGKANEKANDGTTCIWWAAEEGHADCCKVLLECSDEPLCRNGRRYRDEQTPLIRACLNGHISCVETLLQAGAMASLRDVLGNDALGLAIKKGHMDVVPFLRHYIRKEREMTPLKGDLRSTCDYKYGPIRFHPDADKLYLEIPANRRIVRRVLTAEQRAFVRQHLKGWRAWSLQCSIIRTLCHLNGEKKLERSNVLLKKKVKTILKRWKGQVNLSKRLNSLFAGSELKTRRGVFDKARHAARQLELKIILKKRVGQWRAFVTKQRNHRLYGIVMRLQTQNQQRVISCFRNWKWYHTRLASGKTFLRISTYGNLRRRLRCWRVGSRVVKRETTTLFKIVAEWHLAAVLAIGKRLKRRYFSRLKNFYRDRRACELDCRRQLLKPRAHRVWNAWSHFVSAKIMSTRIQRWWRHAIGKKKVSCSPQLPKMRRSRLEIVYDVFKGLARTENQEWMQTICNALDKALKDGKETIDFNGIAELFAKAGMFLYSQRSLASALRKANLPCDKAMRVETFMAWLILVIKKNPMFFRVECSASHSAYVISHDNFTSNVTTAGENFHEGNRSPRRRRSLIGRRRRPSSRVAK